MAVNKVIYGDRTLIDLTRTNITSDDVRDGKIAYGANGEILLGSFSERIEASGVASSELIVDDDYKLIFTEPPTPDPILRYLDPIFSDYGKSWYIRSGTGAWTSIPGYPNFAHSEAVYVPSGATVYINTSDCNGWNASVALCGFVSSPNNLHDQTIHNLVNWDSSNPYKKYEITVPEGYEYVVFSKNCTGGGALLVQPIKTALY